MVKYNITSTVMQSYRPAGKRKRMAVRLCRELEGPHPKFTRARRANELATIASMSARSGIALVAWGWLQNNINAGTSERSQQWSEFLLLGQEF